MPPVSALMKPFSAIVKCYLMPPKGVFPDPWVFIDPEWLKLETFLLYEGSPKLSCVVGWTDGLKRYLPPSAKLGYSNALGVAEVNGVDILGPEGVKREWLMRFCISDEGVLINSDFVMVSSSTFMVRFFFQLLFYLPN
jgi:hypothetical protein